MYFPTSLRMIQLTFLFHDELNVRDRRVERNYRRFGYRFFTPKGCHWRSNWKKICLRVVVRENRAKC